MDFDSPDVMKDFPGLYASELNKQSNNDSDYSDENEKVMKKDILIGKRKEKKDKDKGYAALEGESSADENTKSRSPSKSKKAKSFKFTTKTKEKRDKSREKDSDKKKDRDKKVEKEKSKNEKVKKVKTEESADIGEVLPIFGASLQEAVARSPCHDGIRIPLPVRECIDYLETHGLNFENIYKVSGNKSKVLQIKKMYNQRCNVNLEDYDVPTVTSLLKAYLRDLPEPIFTNDQLIRFEEAGAILSLNTREKHLKLLIPNFLPRLNVLLLSWLVIHLNNISLNKKINKMSKRNLAAALNHTFHCSSRLLNALLHHSQSLFPTITIEKYIPPLESGALLPEDPKSIIVELKKQESLLTQIHSEMNVGCISKQREELLWEVQRIITQLKRKLKSAKKEQKVTEKPVEVVEEAVEEPPATSSELEKPESPKLEASLDEPVPEPVEDPPEEVVDEVDEGGEVEEAVNNSDLQSELDKLIKTATLKKVGLNQLRESLLKRIHQEQCEVESLRAQLADTTPPVVNMVSNENLDEVMDLFMKENQVLQIKKINLVRQIIEEQEMCVDLKAQLVTSI